MSSLDRNEPHVGEDVALSGRVATLKRPPLAARRCHVVRSGRSSGVSQPAATRLLFVPSSRAETLPEARVLGVAGLGEGMERLPTRACRGAAGACPDWKVQVQCLRANHGTTHSMLQTLAREYVTRGSEIFGNMPVISGKTFVTGQCKIGLAR